MKGAVNWIKGQQAGKKKLFTQKGDLKDSPWEWKALEHISSSLSFEADVTMARSLNVNSSSESCYQGQTHGNAGFLLNPEEAKAEILKDKDSFQFIHPYLIADDLLGENDSSPTRYVIDFEDLDILSARHHESLFRRIERSVLPDRKEAARIEEERNAEALKENPKAKVTKDHANALKKWWQLFRSRQEMVKIISKLTYVGT